MVRLIHFVSVWADSAVVFSKVLYALCASLNDGAQLFVSERLSNRVALLS